MSDGSPERDDSPAGRRRWWRRPVVLMVAAVVVVVAGGVALAAFQPWKLVVDQRVDEAAPVAAAPDPTGSRVTPRPTSPQPVAKGSFVSHEHSTTGQAVVLELPDGTRVLRLENLDTSNGPDLRVWLSDAPVIDGTDGWFVFDEHPSVDLGELKGNVGNQNYPIPNSVDLGDYRSVSIWCARFHVSFGAAQLKRV